MGANNQATQIKVVIGKRAVRKELLAPHPENLVLEGGGIRGLAYAGALQVLDEYAILDKIKRVAGSSAGAITALILALGYNAKETAELIRSINFGEMQDNVGLMQTAKNLTNNQKVYLFKGSKLLQVIRERVVKPRIEALIKKYPQQIGPLNLNVDRITFKDLQAIANACPEAGIRELIITGTRVLGDKRGELVLFNTINSPDLELAFAARVSASIPRIFQPVTLSTDEDGKISLDSKGASSRIHEYIDGGCLNNFPIEVFDAPQFVPVSDNIIKHQGVHGQNLCSIGFKVDTKEEIDQLLWHSKPLEAKKTFFGRLLSNTKGALTNLVANVSVTTAEENGHNKLREFFALQTCQLHDLGVGMADFGISVEQQNKLVEEGVQNTRQWLNNYPLHDSLMECEEYTNFEHLCQNMEDEELRKFCTLLTKTENAILFKEDLSSCSEEEYQHYAEIAVKVYKGRLAKIKTGVPVSDPNSKYNELLGVLRASILNFERNAVSDESGGAPEKMEQTRYLNKKQFKADCLKTNFGRVSQLLSKITDMDDKQKMLVLLKVLKPVFNMHVTDGLDTFFTNTTSYKQIVQFVKSYNITDDDMSSAYAAMVFEIRQCVYQLRSLAKSVERKIANHAETKACAIEEKLEEVMESLGGWDPVNNKESDRQGARKLWLEMRKTLGERVVKGTSSSIIEQKINEQPFNSIFGLAQQYRLIEASNVRPAAFFEKNVRHSLRLSQLPGNTNIKGTSFYHPEPEAMKNSLWHNFVGRIRQCMEENNKCGEMAARLKEYLENILTLNSLQLAIETNATWNKRNITDTLTDLAQETANDREFYMSAQAPFDIAALNHLAEELSAIVNRHLKEAGETQEVFLKRIS